MFFNRRAISTRQVSDEKSHVESFVTSRNDTGCCRGGSRISCWGCQFCWGAPPGSANVLYQNKSDFHSAIHFRQQEGRFWYNSGLHTDPGHYTVVGQRCVQKQIQVETGGDRLLRADHPGYHRYHTQL